MSERELKEVHAETRAILEEIAHKFGMPSVRLVCSVLRGALIRVIGGIYVNREGLEQVISLLGGWEWL